MRIGILNTDTIKPKFSEKYGQYPAMFSKIILQTDQNIQLSNYEAHNGEYPKNIDECDSYLITGSKVSAYDDIPWVKELKNFIQFLNSKKKNIIGICFGHQIIAAALGGSVVKSSKGWHVGTDSAQLNKNAALFGRNDEKFNLIYNHQDEVQKLPINGKLLASSSSCPIAMMSIDNHILTFQGHIEFKKDFAKDLLDMRKDIFGKTLYRQACKSLDTPTDELKVTKWILKFLTSN